jgi:outer membrane protein assembly factor BamB
VKLAVVLIAVTACGDNLPRPADPYCDAWHQWGGNPAHTGQSCSTGQPLERVLADVVIDSLVPDELADSDGELIVHYQTPLVAGDSVFVLAKTGVYTPCVLDPDPTMHCQHPEDLYRADTQIWSEVGYTWHDNTLDLQWSFESDWKPPPGIETMFQPALVDTVIAIPAAHGAIALVDMVSGELVRTVAPFGDDANAYVAGALAVGSNFIYYNAVQVDHDKPYNLPIRGSLVAVSIDDDSVRIADYANLVPGAPAGDDQCAGFYDDDDENVPLPWPPPPGPDGMPVLPKQRNCGPQVPGFNSAPAVAFDGTLYVASHSEYNDEYSYITSVNPGSLTGNWATSLRDRLHDGCGVDIPYVSDAPNNPFACSDTAAVGIDPETGLSPAAAVTNASSSSPVAMPGGGVLYGAFTFYNADRGHLFELDADGGYVATYDFGWDTTPAVDASDRIYLKDNHYTFTADGTDAGPYYLTELDPALQPVWQFKSTDTNSCARAADGTVQCTSDHPSGFEWCINAPAVDRAGTMYADSEDGNLYAIGADGQLRDQFFLNTALGASYTPVALDHLGRIYALNAGHMIVVGAN